MIEFFRGCKYFVVFEKFSKFYYLKINCTKSIVSKSFSLKSLFQISPPNKLLVIETDMFFQMCQII